MADAGRLTGAAQPPDFENSPMTKNSTPVAEQITRDISFHRRDLPLSCPPRHQPAWSQHPRVYLALERGAALCPYCGARYHLVD